MKRKNPNRRAPRGNVQQCPSCSSILSAAFCGTMKLKIEWILPATKQQEILAKTSVQGCGFRAEVQQAEKSWNNRGSASKFLVYSKHDRTWCVARRGKFTRHQFANRKHDRHPKSKIKSKTKRSTTSCTVKWNFQFRSTLFYDEMPLRSTKSVVVLHERNGGFCW